MAETTKKPAPAGEAEVVDFRAIMKAGLSKRPVRQVALPPMPSVLPERKAETLVLPREPGVPPLVDLAGRRKFVIVMGPQNAGKTLDMRMVGSELYEADLLKRTCFAPVDPGPRALGRYLDVSQPASARQDDCVDFIEAAHNFMSSDDERRYQIFVLDCGGNNTALPVVLARNPKFVAELEAAGVAVVLSYYWVPRVDDLVLLDQHRDLGLVSPHTMLTMNMAKAARGLESYETMRAQAPWQRLLRAGAAELVLPALAEEWAQEVEHLSLPFWAARDGKVPKGSDAEPLDQAGRVAVAEWMSKWREARSPVASWLR
ncbi:hypothetical protein [Paracraurococcus lichenis]|uniref:ATP-binding protein n=1 Tax=Paracraurococcus lichenis TaxID=3064888 RepID=A0ABT9E850_9PROT|nr:hypothetical protein [Paracraurococcus sp. LOR1-02]MDO9712391.1 hypothetical protein [Paracraurococcus sp. LOR1-02]